MYLCPFAHGKRLVLNECGLLFIQANCTLDQLFFSMASTDPITSEKLNRIIRMEYLTSGEFDGVIFEDNFELAAVRPSLEKALEEESSEERIVCVLLLRCGYLSCFAIDLVPNSKISGFLAVEYKYAEMEQLALNIDLTD